MCEQCNFDECVYNNEGTCEPTGNKCAGCMGVTVERELEVENTEVE